MYRKWKPSKAKKAEYQNQMNEIDKFCRDNGINRSLSSDSYYFNLNGKKYRVSNHTIEQSNRRAYDELTGEKRRELYHENGREENTIYITAGKTRIIQIYNDLKAGCELDARGRVKEGC